VNLRVFGAILKKDIRNLYPMVLLGTLLFAADLVVMRLDLMPVWGMFHVPVLLFTGSLLVFAVIQTDVAASQVDDWLCRPVPRAELLAAKLVLLVGMFYVSRAVTALVLELILGASLAEAVQKALLLEDFISLFVLPVLLFTAMVTRTIVQGLGVLIATSIAVFVIPTPITHEPGPLRPAIGDALMAVGLDWLSFTPATLVPLCLLAVGCWLVYWRRNIRAARLLLGVAILAALLLVLLPMWLAPWKPVYAVQAALTRPDVMPDTRAIYLRPARACFPSTTMRNLATDTAFIAARQASGVWAWNSEDLGEPGPDSLVFLTSIEARRLPKDWRVKLLYVQADYHSAGHAQPLYSLRPMSYDTANTASSLSHAWVLPDFAVRRLIGESQVELKLRYYMTLLEPHEFSLPTDGRRHAVPRLGYCSAKPAAAGDHIEVDCFTGFEKPAQISAELEKIAATRVYGPPNFAPDWARWLTGGSQKLTIGSPRLGRSDRITVTAWTIAGYVEDSLVLPGILGNKTSICPVDNRNRQFQQAIWRDTAKHEASSISVDEGVQLEVLDFGGEGSPLVLLPGLGATAHSFDELAPRLAQRHRVIAITRRGSGYSSRPDFGFDTPRLAQDVLQVMDGMNLGKVLLVGHSIAGEELTWLGGHHPERFSGLVYLDAAYDRSSDSSDNERLRELYRSLPAEPPIPPEAMRNAAAMNKLLAERGHVPLPEGELIAFWNVDQPFLARTPSTDARTAQAMMAALQAPDYAALKIPALAVYAFENPDKPMPPWYDESDAELKATLQEIGRIHWESRRRSIELFRRGVQKGEVLELQNSTHWLIQSNQAEVLEAIETFSQAH